MVRLFFATSLINRVVNDSFIKKVKRKSTGFTTCFWLLFTSLTVTSAPVQQATTPQLKAKAWQQLGDAGFSPDALKAPNIAFDTANTPVVAFQKSPGTNYLDAYEWDGSDWQSIMNVDAMDAGGNSASLVIDSSNNRYIANVSSFFGKELQVFEGSALIWPILTDAGSETIAIADDNAGVPIVADSTGNLFVAYKDATGGVANGKAVVQAWDGSANWNVLGVEGLSAGEVDELDFAVDNNNTLMLAYQDLANNADITVMSWTGSAWQPLGTPGIFGSAVSNIQIKVETQTNTPYILFTYLGSDGTNNVNFIRVMSWDANSSSWSNVGNPVRAAKAQLDFDYSGFSVVPYMVTLLSQDIDLSKFDGTDWTSLGLTAVTDNGDEDFDFAIDNLGAPHILYQDPILAKASVRHLGSTTLPSNFISAGQEDTPLWLAPNVVVEELTDNSTMTLTVTLSDAAAGTIVAEVFGNAIFTFANGVATIVGTEQEINAVLETLYLIPASNYNGSDYSVSFQISDGSNTSDSISSTLIFSSVNDLPQITGGGDVNILEDTPTSLDLTGVSVSDLENDPVSLAVSVSVGTLTVLDDGSGSASGLTVTADTASKVTIAGSISEVNAYLAGTDIIQYTPLANAFGNSADSLTLTVSDEDTGAQSRFDIHITGVNDAPVIGAERWTTVQEFDLGDFETSVNWKSSDRDVELGSVEELILKSDSQGRPYLAGIFENDIDHDEDSIVYRVAVFQYDTGSWQQLGTAILTAWYKSKQNDRFFMEDLGFGFDENDRPYLYYTDKWGTVDPEVDGSDGFQLNTSKEYAVYWDGSDWISIRSGDETTKNTTFAVNASNNIYLAYTSEDFDAASDDPTGAWQFEQYDGSSWVALPARNYAQTDTPLMEVDRDGNLYVAYFDPDNNGGISIAKYDNQADAWQAVGSANVSGKQAADSTPFMTGLHFDDNNKVYLAYAQQNTNNSDGYDHFLMEFRTGSDWQHVGSGALYTAYPNISTGPGALSVTFSGDNAPLVAMKDADDRGRRGFTVQQFTESTWQLQGDPFSRPQGNTSADELLLSFVQDDDIPIMVLRANKDIYVAQIRAVQMPDTTQFYDEDTSSPLFLNNTIISDFENDDVVLTITLSDAAAGSITCNDAGEASLVNTGLVWTLSGSATQVNAALDCFIYAPPLNYFGNDYNVTLTQTDGMDDSVPATITLNVRAINDRPQLSITSDPISLVEGERVQLTTAHLSATDVEDAATSLTYNLLTSPVNGELGRDVTGDGVINAQITSFKQSQLEAGEIYYTHNGSETSTDAFTFDFYDSEGVDGGGAFLNQKLNFAITVVNDLPQLYISDSLRYVENFSDGDTDLTARLNDARSGVISADGLHVYVTSRDDNAITHFTRSTSTGALTPVTIYRHGENGISGLDGARAAAISLDGTTLIATALDSEGLVVFSRDTTTGALTFVKAMADGGQDDIGNTIDGLNGPVRILFSPDGKHFYVNAFDEDEVSAFSFDATTRQVTYLTRYKDNSDGVDGLNEVSGMVMTSAGDFLYVCGRAEDEIAIFTRDATTGLLTFVSVVKTGDEPLNLAISPDDTRIYAANRKDDEVQVFERNLTDGSLLAMSQIEDGDITATTDPVSEQTTQLAAKLNGSFDIYADIEGRYVYAVASVEDALNVFERNPVTSELTLVEVLSDNDAGGPFGLEYSRFVASSPDGKSVYTIAGEDSNGNGAQGIAVFHRAQIKAVDFNQYFAEDPGTLWLARNLSISDEEGGALFTVTFTLSNPDSGVMAATASGSATVLFSNGVLTISGSLDDVNDTLESVTFTPADNYDATTDTITVVVNDGTDNSPGTVVTLQTTSQNNDPFELTVNDTLSANEGANTVISSAVLQATDPDSSDVLTFTVTTSPSQGKLFVDINSNGNLEEDEQVATDGTGTFTQQNIDDGALYYQHDGSETRSDSFVFDLDDVNQTDGFGTTDPLTGQIFAITVNPVNDAPGLVEDVWPEIAELESDSPAVKAEMTVGANGNPYVIYRPENTTNLTVSVFDLVTKKWGSLLSPGSGSGHNRMDIATNSAGVVYVGFNSGSNVNVLKFATNKWEMVGNAGFAPVSVRGLKLKLDSNEQPYVLYQALNSSDPGGVMEFNGSSWETVGDLQMFTDTDDNFDLALDNNDVPYVVYRDSNNNNKGIVKKFVDGNWTVLSEDGFTAGRVTEPRIALDSQNQLYVAYTDGSSVTNVRSLVERFVDDQWQRVGNDAYPANTVLNSFALDSNDVPYLLFTGSDSSIGAMRLDGELWRTSTVASGLTTAAEYIGIAFDAQNTATVIFDNNNPILSQLGISAVTDFSVSLQEDSDAQVLFSDVSLVEPEGDNVTLTLTLSDSTVGTLQGSASGDAQLTILDGVLTLTGAPTDVSDSLTSLTFTPAADYAGSTDNIAIDMQDNNNGVADTITLTLLVSNTNDAPKINSSEITSATEGSLYSYTVTATDVDTDDTLTLAAPTKPNWLSFDSDTGVLSGTPGNDDVGSHDVTLTVTDSGNETDSQSFSISVANANGAPVITSTALTTATEGSLYSYTLTATDSDPGDTIVLAAPLKPDWLGFDADSGVLSGTPGVNDIGDHDIQLTATDLSNAVDTQSFTLTVSFANRAPVITSDAPTSVNEDSLYSYTLTATDADTGDFLTLAAATKPNWLLFDGSTGVLSGTPGNDDVGEHDVILTVTDSSNARDTQNFVITVVNVNDAPEFTSDAVETATEDSLYSYTITVEDPDSGDTLFLEAITQPGWLKLNSQTRELLGTPGNEDVGTHEVVLRVTDNSNASDTQSFIIAVSNVNDAPEITSAAITTAITGTAYSYTLVATDEDSGDDLTLAAPTKPEWLNFNANTGELSGTPGEEHIGSHDVVLTVTDNFNATDTQNFSVTVNNVNRAPVITSTALTSATEDSLYRYTLSVSDADTGDIVVLAAPTKPDWLNFDAANGVLSGTPDNDDVGQHNVSLTATDSQQASDTQSFIVTVTNTNDAPVITSFEVTTAKEDSAYSYTVTVTDEDQSDSVTLSATTKPDWLSFDATTGVLSGIPDNDDVGAHDVRITATDTFSASDSQDFKITVANSNDAPEFTSQPVTDAIEDSVYSYKVEARDPDIGDSISLTLAEQPDWLSFDPVQGVLSGIPKDADVGSHNVEVTAIDSSSVSVAQRFTIIVSNINDAPKITSFAQTGVTQGREYRYEVITTDADASDTVTLAATTKPDWLSFDGATGILSGTPGNSDVGSHSVVITATDTSDAIDVESFFITVANQNDSPVITSQQITAASEDSEYRYAIEVEDIDIDDQIILTAPEKPDWLSFNTGTGELLGTPTNGDVGQHPVTVIATDGSNASDQQQFVITVSNVNDAPVITSGALTSVNQGSLYSYILTTIDVDLEDSVTLAAETKPDWLNFNPDTGILSGIPGNNEVGSYDILLTATDGSNGRDERRFSVTVKNVNDAPIISSQSVTKATEDKEYRYQVEASDIDAGDSVSLAVPTKPDWLRFDTATGVLSGVPGDNDIGSHPVEITVTDSSEAQDRQSFSITVNNVNDAPLITSFAQTGATQGRLYQYTLEAIDADINDAVTLAATEKPAWLSFDPATGELSGEPGNSEVGSHEVILTASDNNSSSDVEHFIITVVNRNDSPEITSNALTSINEDSAYHYGVTTIDIDAGDNVTLAAPIKPDWLSFDTNTGVLSGLPGDDDLGVHPVTITATDSSNANDTQRFTITVSNINDAPVITSTAITTVSQDRQYSHTVTAGDVDNPDTVILAAPTKPDWLSFNPKTGILSGIPGNDEVGTHSVVITATDNSNATDERSFTVTVNNVNDMPIITSDPLTQVAQESEYHYTVSATDVDVEDTVTLAAPTKPDWLRFDANTGSLIGTPGNDEVGIHYVVLTATDNSNASDTQSFSITVANTNDAPVITSQAVTVATEDSPYSYPVTAFDVDPGDTITLAASTKPDWLSFDSSTGVLSGTPDNSEVGTHDIVVSATDSNNETVTQQFTINVANTNDAPVFTSSAVTTAIEDSAYSYTVMASDEDIGDSVTLSVSTKPDWLSFNAVSETLSGTPENSDVGSHNVVLIATDSNNASNSQSFTIVVANTNDAPVITSNAVTSVSEDSGYSYSIVASDVDSGDSVTLSAQTRPDWLSFNEASGVLSGIPRNSDVGSHGVVITATDNSNASDTQSFTITVANTNDAPVITSQAITSATQDVAYSYSITASDVDVDDTLSFSAVTLPGWLSLSSRQGRLSGTPENQDVGEHAVEVVATDSNGTSDSQSFVISVANVNDAPTISGTPVTAAVQGQTYAFAPIAEDIDGDTLTFSVANPPSWTEFDSASGELSGTPQNADVGSYADIVISVADGSLQDSLPAFTIVVSNVNDGPVISGVPATTATEDIEYRFVPEASDPDNDNLTFVIENQPGWLAFDTVNGTLSGIPGDNDVGLHENIIISVTDGLQNAVLNAFDIEVLNINDQAVLSGVPQRFTVTEDVSSHLDLSATSVADDDADARLTLTLSTDAGVLSVTAGDGTEGTRTIAGSNTSMLVIEGTPEDINSLLASDSGGVSQFTYLSAANDDSESSLTLALTDNIGDSVEVNSVIDITPVNDVPDISGEPVVSVRVGETYDFTPDAVDVENDAMRFTIANQPRWTSFDNDTGRLTGAPAANDAGAYGDIMISVSDGESSSSLPAFVIDVVANAVPTITGSPITQIEVNSTYRFEPQAADADEDSLTFSITNLPSWATFDTQTGVITGTPSIADIGTTFAVSVSVTDGIDSAELPAFDIEVCDICNDVPPVISGVPATSVQEGQPYNFTPIATDANGDELSFSINVQPGWSDFDASTGTLSGTPGETDIGTTTGIIVSVSDGNTMVSLAAFNIEVIAVNDAPEVVGVPDTSVFQGDEYRFTPQASDAEGDTLLFTVENLPGWAAFNPVTGTLRGIPGDSDVGNFNNIVISVTDNVNSPASLLPFNIEVVARNTPPVISGEPRTGITQGNNYQFTPEASDVDNDTLTFSISNPPDWASFETNNGTLSGIPGENDVGTFENIVISVSDGTNTAALAGFAIAVTASNGAPQVSDGAAQVAEDTSVFIPANATDPDGDVLTLTVFTVPSNGSLSEASGGWHYSPEENFVGTDSFSYIASDGQAESGIATVEVIVSSVNDAPEAVDDSFNVEQVESGLYLLDVLANDIDVDISTAGDSIILQGADANLGTVAIVDNLLQYDAGSSFFGTVSLQYSMRDTNNVSSSANVSLTINGVAGVGSPVVAVPDDIVVNATGLFTKVDLGVAEAFDADNNPLPVSITTGEPVFEPGSHTVFWQTEDRFGTTTTEAQQVDVRPLISLSDDQVVSEGATVTLQVILNGDAPVYPLSVDYTVSGTASTGIDHGAQSGTVTFTQGREQEIAFEVFIDSEVEADETVVLTLAEDQNIGASNTTQILISEANIPPEITLSVSQNGLDRLTVAQDEGNVNVQATLSDQNPQDSLATEWSSDSLINLSTDASSFSFDPTSVSTGVYSITLFANDDGSPILSANKSVFIEIVETLNVLSDTLDTDGDLIPDAQEGYADSDGDGIPDYLDAISDCNVLPEQANTQDGFLVESDPGVCMRQGATSALNSSDGLQVVLDETGQRRAGKDKLGNNVTFAATAMPEDDSAINIGGVFDFILYDLRLEGQNVQVVFPQVQPIPAAAVYRKFKDSTQTWTDFVTNDDNAVFSAAGEPGVCPPPGDETWQPGLNEGDWCVQLLIEDGGPNDDDNLANGTIVDPGGVAVVLENNSLPEAQDDSVSMQWNTSLEIDVLANDSDSDGDTLTIVNVTASFGSVIINDGRSLSYTPDEGFVGSDNIVYAVSDGNNGTNSAAVEVIINGNRAPGALADVANTDDITPVEIDVLANDIDVDGDPLMLVFADTDKGSVEVTVNQILRYTPLEGFVGISTITYIVNDSFGESATGIVTVTITSSNQAPVALNDSVVTPYNTPVVIDVLANDSDSDDDDLFVAEASAESGDVVINEDNTLTFTPASNFEGSDVINYTVSDGKLTANAQVQVTVQAQPIETISVVNRSKGGSLYWLIMLTALMITWRYWLMVQLKKFGI